MAYPTIAPLEISVADKRYLDFTHPRGTIWPIFKEGERRWEMRQIALMSPFVERETALEQRLEIDFFGLYASRDEDQIAAIGELTMLSWLDLEHSLKIIANFMTYVDES